LSLTSKELMETIEHLRQQLDSVYAERNLVVALATDLATRMGYTSGLSVDDNPDVAREWKNIVFIDIPHSGRELQLSWHIHENELPSFANLPPYERVWDGHTTAEKYDRIEKIIAKRSKI
jgi:hypothetical protein